MQDVSDAPGVAVQIVCYTFTTKAQLLACTDARCSIGSALIRVMPTRDKY
jgi:hypothetical protein